MNELKNIFNNCNELETAYIKKQTELKELLEKNKKLLNTNSSLDLKKLKSLVHKAKNNILSDKQLTQMREEQDNIMNNFHNLDTHKQYKTNQPDIHKHITHVSPIQIVKVDKNNKINKNDNISNDLKKKISNLVESKTKKILHNKYPNSKKDDIHLNFKLLMALKYSILRSFFCSFIFARNDCVCPF